LHVRDIAIKCPVSHARVFEILPEHFAGNGV
jgi:hypothetical protein